VRKRLSNASNMLDVTWEASDGEIVPLDGYLDPYFQEVYLEAESIPIFAKLARHVSGDALQDYVSALEREVRKYLTKDVNYGKAAKTHVQHLPPHGHYTEAAFLRELFDEPATILYQVWSLIRTMDEATLPGSQIPMEDVLEEADRLILGVSMPWREWRRGNRALPVAPSGQPGQAEERTGVAACSRGRPAPK